MNNERLEQKLNELLDKRQSCRETEKNSSLSEQEKQTDCFEAYAQLEAATEQWKAKLPQVDLTDSVLAKLAFDQNNPDAENHLARETTDQSLLSEQSPSRRNHRRGYQVIALFTAVAAVVCLLIFWGPTEPATQDISQTPSQTPAEETTSPIETNSLSDNQTPSVADNSATENADFSDLVQQAGTASLTIASDTAGALSKITSAVMLTQSNFDWRAESENFRPRSNLVPAEWDQPLKPLGKNLSGAFDFLREAVPAESAPAT